MYEKARAGKGVRNVSFSKHFVYVINGWPPFQFFLYQLSKIDFFMLMVEVAASIIDVTWKLNFGVKWVWCQLGDNSLSVG